MALESGIRDPGSGKNPFRIPDPGVKKAPDPGSGSATLIFFSLLGYFRCSGFGLDPGQKWPTKVEEK